MDSTIAQRSRDRGRAPIQSRAVCNVERTHDEREGFCAAPVDLLGLVLYPSTRRSESSSRQRHREDYYYPETLGCLLRSIFWSLASDWIDYPLNMFADARIRSPYTKSL